jgi:mRNA interferase RelE/StbE
MKYWDVTFLPEAIKDREALEASVRNHVDKAIRKVSQNPLPKSEGGYGNPLGHKQGRNLTGFLKIKLSKLGIRVVYSLIRDKGAIRIVVIAARADSEVYKIAASRV